MEILNTGEEAKLQLDVVSSKNFWSKRNTKFREWYDILTLMDKLAARGLESYVSNEPQTFYNMAHYLLTKGILSFKVPLESEDSLEMDKIAKINRSCQYMLDVINKDRRLAGQDGYLEEVAFYELLLGWITTVFQFNKRTNELEAQIWNPYDVYPVYNSNRMIQCTHSYNVTRSDVVDKIHDNDWNPGFKWTSAFETVVLDDIFKLNQGGTWSNLVMIDGKDVTGWVNRPEAQLVVTPVGGFPDKGSIARDKSFYKGLMGRGIFEANSTVYAMVNKWKTMVSQILRDVAQPVTQENSATPQATPETLRERGAHFHYAVGEPGLTRLPTPQIPNEINVHDAGMGVEKQKGSFNNAVYGMVEGQAGYGLSMMASSSANQILYPYMDGKHFTMATGMEFWLKNLKTNKRVFEVKGTFLEKLSPTDIPTDVIVSVESDVAVAKDWLERGTIVGMLREDLDEDTILTDILHQRDPQAIKRKKVNDKIMKHPVTESIQAISGYYAQADYLENVGDTRQAKLFRMAAEQMEAQLGAPAPGQADVQSQAGVNAAREAGAPAERPKVPSNVQPPENAGFTPQELRRTIGRGTLRASR